VASSSWHPYGPDQQFGRQAAADEEQAEAALDQLENGRQEVPRAANKATPDKAIPDRATPNKATPNKATPDRTGRAQGTEPTFTQGAWGEQRVPPDQDVAAGQEEAVEQGLPAEPVRAQGPLKVAPEAGDVVRVQGEVDASTAPELRELLEKVVAPDRQRVVLDVQDLDLKDWTGLGVLVNGRQRLREQGGEMVLRSPTPKTASLLEASGLQRLFTVEAEKVEEK